MCRDEDVHTLKCLSKDRRRPFTLFMQQNTNMKPSVHTTLRVLWPQTQHTHNRTQTVFYANRETSIKSSNKVVRPRPCRLPAYQMYSRYIRMTGMTELISAYGASAPCQNVWPSSDETRRRRIRCYRSRQSNAAKWLSTNKSFGFWFMRVRDRCE